MNGIPNDGFEYNSLYFKIINFHILSVLKI
jgi:hypothetical protein